MFLVSISESQATYVMMYNAIITILDTQLHCESELKEKGQFSSFREITNHQIIKETKSIYKVIVSWKEGPVTWEPVSVMRQEYPI